jgi:hypothetical protein
MTKDGRYAGVAVRSTREHSPAMTMDSRCAGVAETLTAMHQLVLFNANDDTLSDCRQLVLL